MINIEDLFISQRRFAPLPQLTNSGAAGRDAAALTKRLPHA